MLSVAFVTKAYAHAIVSTAVDPQDITYLRSIQNSTTVAASEALNAVVSPNGSNEITKNLNSTASGRAAVVSDYGVAVARQFEVGGIPLSLGVTPKLQKTLGSGTTPPLFMTITAVSGTIAAIVPMIPVLTWMSARRQI